MNLEKGGNEKTQDKPPSYHNGKYQWLVAVIANLKGETPHPVDRPPDADAEYDRQDTVEAILQVLQSDGHQAVFIPANQDLPFTLREVRPDICFNLAEGAAGDAREAQVPALLELFEIPYTGSRVLPNAISLDKTITKRIWRDAHLPIAPFQEFLSEQDSLRPGLHFPLFVKPVHEGTGKGVDQDALVHNEKELHERVAWVIHTYRQPALVETYLPGREFTVGVLGNSMTASYTHRPELYAPDGFHRFPIPEIVSEQSVTPGVYGYQAKSRDLWEIGSVGYYCPAKIDPELSEIMQRLALRAHRAIGALDVSRVDIRLDVEGKPRLMEINTLPGLAPDFSDLCLMARAEGLEYRDLILEILYLAAARCGLMNLPIDLAMRSVQAVRNRS